MCDRRDEEVAEDLTDLAKTWGATDMWAEPEHAVIYLARLMDVLRDNLDECRAGNTSSAKGQP